MYHRVNNLQTRSGDALSGYFIKLKDEDGNYATLYSDENLTPIINVSGLANAAKTDDEGMYDHYVADGIYDEEYYDKHDSTVLIDRTLALPMFSNTSTEAVLARLAEDDGAGLIGSTISDTVQTAISSTVSGAAHFWQKVRGESSDVHVFVGSDSTGNEVTEWPYLTATWIAGQAATHTVKFRFWNSGTNSWDAYTTLATGSGARTIYFHVCAVAGKNSFYLQGANEPTIFDRGDYSLAILNFGHNLGTDNREAEMFDECLLAAAHVQSHAPYASMFVTAQNPRSSVNGAGQSYALAAVWRKVADIMRCGLIDVWTAFHDRADYADLMNDETHPNNAGQLVWLGVVQQSLYEPTTLDLPLLRPSCESAFGRVGVNYLRNPWFSDWAAGEDPANWSVTNCAVGKEPGRSRGAPYSMGITASGSQGYISQQIPFNLVKTLRGRRIFVLAPIWKDSGNSTLAGRISLTSNNGSVSVSNTSVARGDEATDGFAWVMTSVYVQGENDTGGPATSINVQLYSGDGTDAGGQLWVEGIAVFADVLPCWIANDDWRDMVIEEYYSALNVSPKSAGDDGDLTVTGTGFSVASASPGATNTVVDLPPLEIGQGYRVTFTTGAGDGTGGPVYARNGPGGGSSTLKQLDGVTDATLTWAASHASPAYELEFLPESATTSLWFATFSLGTAMDIENLSITKIDAIDPRITTLWVPAADMVARTTNGAAAGSTESATNKIMVKSLDFDQSTDEFAQVSIAMPKSWDEGTVTAQFVWSSTATGNVVWGAQAVALSNDDVIDAAFGTAQTVTDGVTATTDLMTSAYTSAITIAGSPAEEDVVVFQFYRDADNVADTVAADAKLLGVRLKFSLNATDDS